MRRRSARKRADDYFKIWGGSKTRFSAELNPRVLIGCGKTAAVCTGRTQCGLHLVLRNSNVNKPQLKREHDEFSSDCVAEWMIRVLVKGQDLQVTSIATNATSGSLTPCFVH
jgi:hypothetical protein